MCVIYWGKKPKPFCLVFNSLNSASVIDRILKMYSAVQHNPRHFSGPNFIIQVVLDLLYSIEIRLRVSDLDCKNPDNSYFPKVSCLSPDFCNSSKVTLSCPLVSCRDTGLKWKPIPACVRSHCLSFLREFKETVSKMFGWEGVNEWKSGWLEDLYCYLPRYLIHSISSATTPWLYDEAQRSAFSLFAVVSAFHLHDRKRNRRSFNTRKQKVARFPWRRRR